MVKRQPFGVCGVVVIKVKVLKVKFQNLGENGAEAHFNWEPNSGCFIPKVMPTADPNDKLPWE